MNWDTIESIGKCTPYNYFQKLDLNNGIDLDIKDGKYDFH